MRRQVVEFLIVLCAGMGVAILMLGAAGFFD